MYSWTTVPGKGKGSLEVASYIYWFERGPDNSRKKSYNHERKKLKKKNPGIRAPTLKIIFIDILSYYRFA